MWLINQYKDTVQHATVYNLYVVHRKSNGLLCKIHQIDLFTSNGFSTLSCLDLTTIIFLLICFQVARYK